MAIRRARLGCARGLSFYILGGFCLCCRPTAGVPASPRLPVPPQVSGGAMSREPKGENVDVLPVSMRKRTGSGSSLRPVGIDLRVAEEEDDDATGSLAVRRRRLQGVVVAAVSVCGLILVAAAGTQVARASAGTPATVVAAKLAEAPAPAAEPPAATPVAEAPPAPATAPQAPIPLRRLESARFACGGRPFQVTFGSTGKR